MIVVPQIPRIQGGESLNFKKINHIIKRIEYAAEIASQVKSEEAIDISPCLAVSHWTERNYFGFDVCPNVGPPCNISGTASCTGKFVSGEIVSSIRWPTYCISKLKFRPKLSFSVLLDDYGSFAGIFRPLPTICQSSSLSGETDSQIVFEDGNKFFRLRTGYQAINGTQGGPYGFIGSGAFYLDNPND